MNWLYETPWWLPTGLGLVGLVLLVTGNNRMEKRLMRAGIGLILLAIGIAVGSWFLESDRERVARHTRELIASIDNRDWQTTGGLLASDVLLQLGPMEIESSTEVVATAREKADQFQVKNLRIVGGVKTSAAERQIISTVQVAADAREWSNVMTGWELDWEKNGPDWQVREIRFLGGPGISASDAARQVPRAR